MKSKVPAVTVPPAGPEDAFQSARRRFLKAGGSFAALLPLLSCAAFEATSTTARPAGAAPVDGARALKLWYPTPAAEAVTIEQALPVGNGRIGALVGGDPARDFLYLTDISLWLGGRNDTLGSDGQPPYASDNFGSFQMLAKLYLDLPAHALSAVSDYRRELDLSNGCARVSYVYGGVRYLREVFASHPDDVIVLRLSQSGGGSYSGAIELQGTRGESTAADDGLAALSFASTLANGLKYAAHVRANASGGKLTATAGKLAFEECRALTLVFCGGTNYVPDPARGYMDVGRDPLALARVKSAAALALPFEALYAVHVADHRALFERMHVDLGPSTPAQRALDTWSRLKARAVAGAAPDPELEALYLQFGRYLTIASSRDSLPANLQGMWLSDNSPAWFADYHTDINVQMNYWLADRANLSTCFDAFTDYCLAQVDGWTAVTRERFNDPSNGFRNTSGKVAGWAVSFSTNIYGGNGWWWHPAGNAWLCNNLWQHYEYTLDRRHLERIYPLLKGACEFWEARLITTTVTDPATGASREVLIDDHDWSPEQGPTDARGVTYAQELVWDLFGHYQQASALLGRDAGYARTIAAMRERLYLPVVSPTSGQLEEWMSPDSLSSDITHRHLSPLIGFFPGDRITYDESPSWLLDGVTKLLTVRGMISYGWACAWRACCWARLKQADKAYQLLIENLAPSIDGSNGTAPNFFDEYSLNPGQGIFQIDANFGTPTAMLEMLLYSRPGRIELLPALPQAWAASGRVTGIGARSGFRVDLAWRDGKPTEVTVHSVGGTGTRIVCGKNARSLTLRPGQAVRLHGPALLPG